jgi:Histidine-specific methyltransferase, SAM-dependent
MSKTKKNRLNDWLLKRDIIRHLLEIHGSTIGDLVEGVMRDTDEYNADATLVERLTDAARKWPDSTPTSRDSLLLWRQIGSLLNCHAYIDPETLIESDIDAFVGYIKHPPSNAKAAARLAFLQSRANGAEPQPRSGPTRETLYPIWTYDSGSVQTIRDGIAEGNIKQEHYYLDPDSAQAWSDLVGDGSYPTYDECKFGLRDLGKCEHWVRAVRLLKPSTVVMLAGGGAATKDLELLRSLVNQVESRLVTHYLVDISFFMLVNSKRSLEQLLRKYGIDKKVNVDVMRKDVLRLDESDRSRFHHDGGVIFAITGGTIGNLSETRFFDSLGRAANAGDLLIVSADTLDDLSDDEKRQLLGKYNNQALRSFIKPVVRTVLHEARVTGSVDDLLAGCIKTDFLENEKSPSDLPETGTVTVQLGIEGRSPITLVTSTRYRSSALDAFAKRHGWDPVCHIQSPLNKHFKQFLFRRKE